MPAEPLAATHHPVLLRLAHGFGWLCLVTTLALSAPGVVATAKGEPVAPEVQGPSCSAAEGSGEGQVVLLTRMIEQLRADAARHADPSNEVIPLDNRGFTYPVEPLPTPPPGADPQ